MCISNHPYPYTAFRAHMIANHSIYTYFFVSTNWSKNGASHKHQQSLNLTLIVYSSHTTFPEFQCALRAVSFSVGGRIFTHTNTDCDATLCATQHPPPATPPGYGIMCADNRFFVDLKFVSISCVWMRTITHWLYAASAAIQRSQNTFGDRQMECL